MDENEFINKLQDRTVRYAGYALDPSVRIHVTANVPFIETYAGQVCAYVLFSLLARMNVSVTIDPVFENIQAIEGFSGSSFSGIALKHMLLANPFGKFTITSNLSKSFIVHLGPGGNKTLRPDMYLDGMGWNAYCGVEVAESLPKGGKENIFGVALAAILGGSQIFYRQAKSFASLTMNAWDWSINELVSAHQSILMDPEKTQEVWFIGSGSVGTATAFFLTLATRTFAACVIDGDRVSIENIARSPVFNAEVLGENKAFTLTKWLKSQGIQINGVHDRFLHDVPEWLCRNSGTPDVLVSAANDYNVRSVIESGRPPLQIYGTTGNNNQACLIRHIPGVDPCSLCLFPPENFTETRCATGANPISKKAPDSALPFLSYLAGLLAAAEILKQPLNASTSNRHIITLAPEITSAKRPFSFRDECSCNVGD